MYYRNAHSAVVVYDVTSSVSTFRPPTAAPAMTSARARPGVPLAPTSTTCHADHVSAMHVFPCFPANRHHLLKLDHGLPNFNVRQILPSSSASPATSSTWPKQVSVKSRLKRHRNSQTRRVFCSLKSPPRPPRTSRRCSKQSVSNDAARSRQGYSPEPNDAGC